MSHYNEVNPPSVYQDDCLCAHSDTGYDDRCPSHREIPSIGLTTAQVEARNAATAAVAADILADPDWTRRVVIAAVVAESLLPFGHPARVVLNVVGR